MVSLTSKSKMMMKKSSVPKAYICPLTKGIMVDPLMNRDGRSYERTAIIDHITNKERPYCPVTREPLSVKDLIPNYKLRNEIMTYREEILGDVSTSTNNMHNDERIFEVECIRALHLAFSPQKKSPKRNMKNIVARFAVSPSKA